MDLNDLTIGQAKELASLFSKQEYKGFYDNYIGKYVIVRSRNEGINAGIVKECDPTGIVLSNARRIWYHKPSDKRVSWYEGVAKTGLSSDSKISCEVEEKVIIENYSITICSEVAKKSIIKHESHGTN